MENERLDHKQREGVAATTLTAGSSLADAPLGPYRLHPAWIVIGVARWLRALAVPLVLAVITRDSVYVQIVYAGAAGIGVLAGVGRVIEWRRLHYTVAGNELRVTSGLLERQERLVPLERIQSVEISESLLQRLFRVVGVKIETAAGGQRGSDVTLDALSRADARTLRERLLARTPTPTAAPSDPRSPTADHPPPTTDHSPPTPDLIRAISPAALLILGATSSRAGPALAVLIAVLEPINDLFGDRLAALFGVEAGGVRGLIIVLGLLGGGAWLLAIVSAVLTFGGFELRREGDRLLISHGLLDRRRRSVPLARIQAVRVNESILRQPFGLAAVQFDSAGYGRATPDSGVLFPLLPRAQVPALLAAASPAFAVEGDPPLHRPPSRARIRYLLNPVWGVLILSAVVLLIGVWVPWASWWWGLIPLACTPPAALLGLWRYRDTGWALDATDRVIVRGRSLGRTTVVAQRRRIQQREVSRTVFQRRARLATFRAGIAAGGLNRWIVLQHLDEAVAFALAERTGPHRRDRS
ncbi:MAG: PH domain-containing protein [Dehalococcoidia bacterium]